MTVSINQSNDQSIEYQSIRAPLLCMYNVRMYVCSRLAPVCENVCMYVWMNASFTTKNEQELKLARMKMRWWRCDDDGWNETLKRLFMPVTVHGAIVYGKSRWIGIAVYITIVIDAFSCMRGLHTHEEKDPFSRWRSIMASHSHFFIQTNAFFALLCTPLLLLHGHVSVVCVPGSLKSKMKDNLRKLFESILTQASSTY